MALENLNSHPADCCPYAAEHRIASCPDLENLVCQHTAIENASSGVRPWLLEMLRIKWSWKRDNFKSFLKRQLVRLKTRIIGAPGRTAPADVQCLSLTDSQDGECLWLKPGELVQVRPREQILRTLDSRQRHKGLLFMPGMWRLCGKEFRVYKQVKNIQMESTGEVRRLSNTVLLEGAVCEGSIVECDRSCFYFWREAWLERVHPPENTN